MKIKKYKLHKSAMNTAKANNLLIIKGNDVTDHTLLFDFSFLDSLEIPDNEKEAVKKEAMSHCSAANRTAFVLYHADDFTVCDVIVDFNYHRVFSSKTWKLAYAIMEVSRIKYCHAERSSVYDHYYRENVRNVELLESGTVAPELCYEV